MAYLGILYQLSFSNSCHSFLKLFPPHPAPIRDPPRAQIGVGNYLLSLPGPLPLLCARTRILKNALEISRRRGEPGDEINSEFTRRSAGLSSEIVCAPLNGLNGV